MSQSQSNAELYNAPAPKQQIQGTATPTTEVDVAAVPSIPSSGKQDTNTTILYVLIASLAVLLVGTIVAFVLWRNASVASSRGHGADNQSAVVDTIVVRERTVVSSPSRQAYGDEVEAVLLKRIAEWDRMHRLGGEEEVFGLYASMPVFYTKRCTRHEIVTILHELLVKAPDYVQTSHDVHFSEIKPGVMRCDFTKSTVSNGVSRDYPSYLEFSWDGMQWLITCESDAVTDHNVRKRK